MSKPRPVTTPYWMGQTVYLKHGGRAKGLVVAVIMEGDPANPSVRFRVTWPKCATTEEYFDYELTTERPPKKAFQP